MEKFRFRPFRRYAEGTAENLEKLNSIRSLYYAYRDSGLPARDLAQEFYTAVGRVLAGERPEDLELEYVEFEQPEDAKEITLSVPLLEAQISSVLSSNMDEKSKEGLHNLLGTLLDYSGEGVRKIRLVSTSERED
ncbi:MAG: hypothetical protein JRJ75_11050 [Deltaproteobacteria bacterium]|nr:hypothetical protein [Deltaproteobacteria bacterium]